MKMTAKRKKILSRIFAPTADNILQAMSSEYCEGEEKQFRDNFGFSSKDALAALEALKYTYRA